jgi:hypothetical protein
MTSRPAAPESLVPIHGYLDGKAVVDISALEQLERMYALAQTEIKGHMRIEDDLKADLFKAQARIAELEKDALRYRWLRDRPSLIGWDWWVVKVPLDTNICPEFLDAAIDAALKSRA